MANPEHLEILRQGVEAWNRWREENPEVRPDLSKANLVGANVQGINLQNAILLDADLRGADLRNAVLRGVDLEFASLKGANLRFASLWYSNLRCTNLEGAVLRDAHLCGGCLQDTNLQGATFEWTSIGNVILSQAKGIESVRHWGPSVIATSTLERTAEGLSQDPSNQGSVETFLRGAGVEEHIINYFRSMIGKPIEFYSCFISYSHPDKAFARRLYDSLQGRGIRCWLDEHQILPGDHILDEVDRGIRIWDKVLLCCSEESLTSIWVDRELEKAFQKEERLWKERGKRVLAIIPLNLDGYLFKWQSGNASVLLSRLAADFTGWEKDNAKFEAQFDKVVKALRTDPQARGEEPEPRL